MLIVLKKIHNEKLRYFLNKVASFCYSFFLFSFLTIYNDRLFFSTSEMFTPEPDSFLSFILIVGIVFAEVFGLGRTFRRFVTVPSS